MEAGVQRWAVNIRKWTPSESQFLASVDLLPVSERPLVLRYLRFEDRKRALVSRLLQRKLVHSLLHICYDDILIERTKEGKPYLANSVDRSPFPNLNFNVAHHGDFVVLASEPLCLVGVDVMTHEPTSAEPPAVFFHPFRNCYTRNEWDAILNSGAKSDLLFDQFYRFWCLKEAYIKAVGIGLGFELLRAEFFYPAGDNWSDRAHVCIDGQEKLDWRFDLHRLGNDHWASVARGPPEEAIDSYKKTLWLTDYDQMTFAAALALPEKEFSILEVWDLIPDLKKPNLQNAKS